MTLREWVEDELGDDQKLLIVSLALIVGGAIGNLVERIRHGYVVDFIEWYGRGSSLTTAIAVWPRNLL